MNRMFHFALCLCGGAVFIGDVGCRVCDSWNCMVYVGSLGGVWNSWFVRNGLLLLLLRLGREDRG
jgi:hypothetical protein